jgi:hypothetical protein
MKKAILVTALLIPMRLAAQVIANDGTFKVSLPGGWEQIGEATLERALFFRGQESFAAGVEQVWTNPAMLHYSLPGYAAILPPAQLALKSRLLSPPLNPEQIVTELFPQLAGRLRDRGGAVQNLRIFNSIPAGGQEYGFDAQLITYEYILVPRFDDAFTAAVLPPALRAQRDGAAMWAAAFIVTFPYTGGGTWSFGYRVINAPQAVFLRNKQEYFRILQSFELIPEGLIAKIDINADRAKLAESMNKTTQDVADKWWQRLGSLSTPGTTPNAPAGQERGPLPDPGCDWNQYYVCEIPYQHWECAPREPERTQRQCTHSSPK